MNTEDYLKDISEIKTLMNKSSRFISLSGLAGILAGIYALIGAAFSYWLVNKYSHGRLLLDGWVYRTILLVMLLVLVTSISTAILLTTKKAKQNGEKIWDPTTRLLLKSFLIPLIAGGIYTFIILSQQRYGQTGALMLLFYGIALVNASKYTIGYVKYLGYTEITLGLICAVLPGYGIWFWVIGFGFMHIIYGAMMYFNQEKK